MDMYNKLLQFKTLLSKLILLNFFSLGSITREIKEQCTVIYDINIG